MITWMRRYRKILNVSLIVVAAGFAASLFVFGASGFRGDERSASSVATVNGESIPVERYQRRYQAYLDAYTQMYRDRFTPELAERMGLSQQVVNDLVQEAVIVQRARAEGPELTDEELNAQIQAIPSFREGGRFSLKRYQEMLRRRGVSAAQFEADVRRELTRMKVEQAIKSGVKVSDAELERAFALQREEVRATWALVDLAPLVAAATVTDDELAAYLKGHAQEFQLPERRVIQYVTITPRDFMKPVSEAGVEKYYTDHARDFEVPREAQIAHILVRIPETGGSAAEDRTKAKAADLIRRAKAGEDFGKLARENSEDPGSAAQGGDLGWIRAGQVFPEFEQAAFALKKGEISAPVRTPFGYHAIRVLEVREGGKSPLKEVAPRIKETLAAQKSERAAAARADEMKAGLAGAKDFAAEAKRLGLEPREASFGRGDALAEAGRDPQLDETIFSLAVGGVSAPLKTAGGYAVIKVVQQIPAGVPPMAEIRDRVVEAIRRERAAQQVADKAKALAAEVSKGGDFAAAAKAAGFTTGDVPLFSRADPPKERGSLPGGVLLAALQTPVGKIAEPVRVEDGVYVVKTVERQPAPAEGFDRERPELEKQVLEQKRALAWESWIRGRLAQAKVEVGGQPATLTR